MSQRWLNGAAYFTALLAASWALRAAAPFPDIPQVRQKLEAFAAETRCDVLFFGSSKIYSGIIPRQFDAALERRGVKVRTFNLGVDGMGFPESAYLCEHALKRHDGRKVEWIFIEAAGIRTAIPESQRETRRVIYWHDFHRAWTVLRVLLADIATTSAGTKRSRGLLFEHIGLWFRRMSNIGEASEWIAAFTLGAQMAGEQEAGHRDAFVRKERGYIPIAGRMPEREWVKFRTALGSPREAMSPQVAKVTADVFRGFSESMKRAGATVIYLVPPNPKAHEPIFGTGAETPPVFSFDDAQRYPEFYDPAHRSDYAHLNHQGAELFTSAVAERFAAYLTEHGAR